MEAQALGPLGRFVCVRKEVAARQAGPLQLDLFVPQAPGREFKVIVTNRPCARPPSWPSTTAGAQEGVFAQLKTQRHIDYVPCRRLVGNQIFLLAGIIAHNLGRELQMATRPVERVTPRPGWRSGVSTRCRHSAGRSSRAPGA